MRLVILPGPSPAAWRLVEVTIARALPRRGASAAGGGVAVAKGKLTANGDAGVVVLAVVVAVRAAPETPALFPEDPD